MFLPLTNHPLAESEILIIFAIFWPLAQPKIEKKNLDQVGR